MNAQAREQAAKVAALERQISQKQAEADGVAATIAKLEASLPLVQQEAVLREVYPGLPRISVDYAVMEPAAQGKGKASVAVVEMPVEWLDVGSWPALADTLRLDEHDNALDCPVCVLLDSDNNIIVSHDPDHLIASVGLSDMIVVHTKDVTLVCPKRDAQRVK